MRITLLTGERARLITTGLLHVTGVRVEPDTGTLYVTHSGGTPGDVTDAQLLQSVNEYWRCNAQEQ